MATPVEFVELEVAKAARGLRLVTVGGIPSPWSEAAKALFVCKQIPFVAVRLNPGDKEVRKWTRSANAPAAMYEDEPAKTGWAEILELGERLAPERSLVPAGPQDRIRFFGLAHEVMGAGGLLWCSRLLTIQAGIESDGARGFPPFVGRYLGERYGLSKAELSRAQVRVNEALELLVETLGAREYFFGDKLSALDLYAAAAMNTFAPMSEELCPMLPPIRSAFESMQSELPALPTLLAHRQRIYEQHLELPIRV